MIVEWNDAPRELLEPKPEPPKAKYPKTTATVGAIAAVLLATLLTRWEGTELKAYQDLVGVWTVCTGDTSAVTPGMVETPEGCSYRLDRQMERHVAGAVRCTPGIRAVPEFAAAAGSLAYNIGVDGYCRSSIARRFNAEDYAGACDAFLLYDKAGGRVIRGLQKRRQAERSLCLKGIVQ